ncbi:MAG: hypothetical protein RLZ40_103 [Actinomycetota bacterium]
MGENGVVTERHLTKSDFKLGYQCPFKLKYKKAKYPSTLAPSPT